MHDDSDIDILVIDEAPRGVLELKLVVCPRKDFTLASRGRRLAETPYFQGDSGRERYRATEVELQTCSSDTPLDIGASLPDRVRWTDIMVLTPGGVAKRLQREDETFMQILDEATVLHESEAETRP